MKRLGQIIRLKPGAEVDYKRLHQEIWPEIASAIRDAGIRNYSIFLNDGVLFAYYEYIGSEDDYTAAMARIAQAPRMREWWDLTDAMQMPFPGRASGAWWSDSEEVFHLD